MKISNLILRLEKLKLKHGDIQVEVDSDDGMCSGINRARFVRVQLSDSERGNVVIIAAGPKGE